MTGIVAHTYPEWWLKLAGQVAHWSTDYSPFVQKSDYTFRLIQNPHKIADNSYKTN